jgi:hypothetical protein
MRYLTFASLLCLCCAACKDDDPHVDPNKQPDSGSENRDKDAGTKPAGDASIQDPKDGGATPAASSLRPGLPRPPNGLPPELRPPR